MPNLNIAITRNSGDLIGSYVLHCAERPGLDGEEFDARYVIDLIRSNAERQRFVPDFQLPPELSTEQVTFQLSDPSGGARVQNINELWFEIEGLFMRARLGFATSRTLKMLEDEHTDGSDPTANLRANLHLDKMERFDLATFELVRIEDLVARTIYEYFGSGFHQDIDERFPNWDRKVTWDRMKDGLNKRRNSERQPHPRLEAMTDAEYIHLIGAVRDYRSADVLSLVSYRDRRTHRVAPQVDHIGFGGTLLMPQDGPTFMTGSTPVEFQYLDLYATAINTYSHLLDITARVNQIIHAR